MLFSAVKPLISPLRYIRASEINTYLFCHRAWHLSKRGVVSSLEPKRAAGVAHHQAHGERVQTARAAASISTWFGVAAILLLVVFAWMVLR